MRKNPLLLLLPLALLIFAASCKKDLNVINGTLKSSIKHQDRGFIVIAQEGAELSGITESLKQLGAKKFQVKDQLNELGLIHVQTPDPSFPEKARKIAGVQSVAVDVVLNWRLPEKIYKSREYRKAGSPASPSVSGKPIPGNPLAFLQWNLHSVKAPEAWGKGYKGNGATVAVLDGGFLLNDPEIAPNIVGSHSFIEGEEVQYHGLEGISHGTHVAGTIAALDDDYGVVGVAPEAKLLLVKVLSDEGTGPWSAIIDGIFYAVNHKADVINMSLGGELPRRTYTDDNGTPDDPSDDYVVEYDRDVKDLILALNRATLWANLRGATVVAAAGNDGYNYDVEKDFITYPAAALGVLSISSNGPLGWGINQDTTLYVPSIFTNYGKKFISYGAPGGNYSDPLNTTIVNVGGIIRPEYVFDFVFNIGGYDEASGFFFYVWSTGTSMAAPHASAAAAMIYGKYGKLANSILVELLLRKSSTDLGAPGKDKYFGNGQINAAKAVSY
jgi:subtilisin family serine protease